MQNAGRTLPIIDARTAALKFAMVYSKVLNGRFIDYSHYSPILKHLLAKFERELDIKIHKDSDRPLKRKQRIYIIASYGCISFWYQWRTLAS